MSRTALAFMSYVNEDDRHDNGWMTQFRERLSGEVRMHTGEPFDIFQDRKDIAWGQQWQERINQSLDAVTFLIPILTPAFFKSAACRDELERFLKREETLGRSDLILPVYYVNCPVLQDKAKREQDELAKIIAARQYADWRDLRFEEFTSSLLRKALAKVAQQIMEALERSEAESVRIEAMRPSVIITSSCTITKHGVILGTAEKNEVPTVVVDAMHRGDYATITEAIKAAKPGTRILVQPGWYNESIVIDKPIEIIGDGNREEIVIEASGQHTVVFQADSGRIANLTLRQAGGGELYAVDITQGRLELEACDISSQSWAGVAIHGSANPTLRRNRIHDGKSSGGVMVWDKGQGTLEDNEIFANEWAGVWIRDDGKLTLRRNRISKNGWEGIRVFSKGGGIFEDNDLRDNTEGAWYIDADCKARVQRRGNKE